MGNKTITRSERRAAVQTGLIVAARETALDNAVSTLLADAPEWAQQMVKSAYSVRGWSFPNGSAGREVRFVGHGGRVIPQGGWCGMHHIEAPYARGFAIHVVANEDGSESYLILVDHRTRKVNAVVDFGIYHYSGDLEMEGMPIAALLD